MSVVDPARERRKFVNPKFPLGSTWGPRGDGPLCGPGCINGANDPGVAMDAEYLSDADMRDIVRRAQAFLQHHGPCRDEDLWGLVDPWQARLVRSSFGSLAAYLAKQPGFHCQRRGEHALLCYWGPKKEGGHFPQSTSCHPLSSGHPGGSFPKGGLAKGGAAEGRRGRRGSPSGSSSGGSYKSALEDLDGEEKGERAEQKKPRRQRPPSGTTSTCYDTKGVQTVPTVRDSEAQTDEPDNTPEELSDEEQRRRWEEASRIEAKQASLDKARSRDMGLALDELHYELEEILSKLEEMQYRYRRVMPPTPPPSGGQPGEEEDPNGSVSVEGDNQSGFPASGRGDGGGGASASSMEEEGAKEAVLPATVEEGEVGVAESAAEEEPPPRRRPRCCCPQCRSLAPAPIGASDADPPEQVPKLVEVYQPSPETASAIWDLESMASSRGASVGSVPQSRSEAQIVKIVKLVKKRMPAFTEAEIRRHVDEVRILHGGFSRMVIRNIVALVMKHMCNMADAPGNEET